MNVGFRTPEGKDYFVDNDIDRNIIFK